MDRLFALLLLCLAVGTANAAAPDLRDVDATIEAFRTDQHAGYHALHARYRAAIAAAPNDVELAVARCRFLEKFGTATDTNWTKAADDELKACREQLKQRWPTAPAVRVYTIEHDSSEDAIELAQQAWDEPSNWPMALNARLATRLHALYQEDADEDNAGFYASEAARLGNPDLLAPAIRYLDAKGKHADALKLVAKSEPASERSLAFERVDALLDIDEPKAARREMERSIAAGTDVTPATEIRVYLANQDLAAANKAGEKLADQSYADKWRFELALANKDMAKARRLAAADSDFDSGVERYSKILAEDRWSALSPTLLPVTARLLALLLLFAAMLGLILVPVHYRGLELQLRHRRPKPLFEDIGLRHAWLALGAAFIVPIIAAGIFDPGEIPGMLLEGVEIESPFIIDLVGSLATMLILLPWMRRMGVSIADARRLLDWRVLATVFACYLLVNGVEEISDFLYDLLIGGDPTTAQTRAVKSLVDDGRSQFGMLATVSLLAILTPIVEEGVFRGMLLAGLARRISFGWANTIQATLFVAVHGDPPGSPFYFAMGLLGGWLTRRYRSVLPAMLMHGLVNASATLLNVYW